MEDTGERTKHFPPRSMMPATMVLANDDDPPVGKKLPPLKNTWHTGAVASSGTSVFGSVKSQLFGSTILKQDVRSGTA